MFYFVPKTDTSDGLVVKALDIQFGAPCSNPLGGSMVNLNLAFQPSEVDKMSTRNIWELSGKK